MQRPYKTLATLSDGKVMTSVRSYRQFEAKLSREQYLNRYKEVGSANWKKAQLKIARLHGKVVNIRHDALHKLTTNKCQKPQPTPLAPRTGGDGGG